MRRTTYADDQEGVQLNMCKNWLEEAQQVLEQQDFY